MSLVAEPRKSEDKKCQDRRSEQRRKPSDRNPKKHVASIHPPPRANEIRQSIQLIDLQPSTL
jgi:hypothetical protein